MEHSLNSLLNLNGNAAIVTGGAGWLGTSISEALAEAGAEVMIADYNEEALEKTVQRFTANNLRVSGSKVDVMDEETLKSFIDQAAENFGRLDILVNCAYSGPVPRVADASASDYDKGFHNGPTAYAVAARQAAVHMRKSGGGSMINLASMYGQVTGYPEVYEGLTSPNSIVYQAGKAAIIHMTRYMAVYWAGDNIRVNCISPGPFPRPEAGETLIDRIKKKTPMGRIGQPWELKGAVVFLASRAASYMTGQNLTIDGGWTCW